MPSTSISQQQLFGIALSVKRGEKPRGDVSDNILALVDRMSEEEIEKYAATPHDGLPHTVEQKLREMIRKQIREIKQI